MPEPSNLRCEPSAKFVGLNDYQPNLCYISGWGRQPHSSQIWRAALQLSVVVASRRCERLTQGVLGKGVAGKVVTGNKKREHFWFINRIKIITILLYEIGN